MTIIAHSLTITPAADCRVVVTATFDAQATGSATDWGTGPIAQLQVTQSGYTNVSNNQPMSTSRVRYAMQDVFDVTAGSAVVVSLVISPPAGAGATAWNIKLQTEQIKR